MFMLRRALTLPSQLPSAPLRFGSRCLSVSAPFFGGVIGW